MSKKDGRKFNRFKVTRMFVFTAAIAAVYTVFALREETSWLFLLLMGILLVLYICLNLVWVRTIVSKPLVLLLRGMTGDKNALPVNCPGAVGEAAVAFLELQQNLDYMRDELDKSRSEAAGLTARIGELDGQVSELKKTVYSMSESTENLEKEFSETAKRGARDGEELDRLKDGYESLVSRTAAVFDAIADGNYNISYEQKDDALDKKLQAALNHIAGLSSGTAASNFGLKNTINHLSGLVKGLEDSVRNETILSSLDTNTREILKKIEINSGHASKASEITLSMKGKFEEGYGVVKDMDANMREIDSMSGNIMNVIKSIDDIAFQTQLLSLNANIEAARAGHFGRSFAVVASKVGELAGKSKESADETKTLLEGMIEKFHEGAQMSEKTAKIMTEFLDGLTKIIGFVDETRKGISEESVLAGELAEAAHNIADSADTSRIMSEKLVSAVSELSGGEDGGRGEARLRPEPVAAPVARPVVKPVKQPEVKPVLQTAVKPPPKPVLPVAKPPVLPVAKPVQPVAKPPVEPPTPVIKPATPVVKAAESVAKPVTPAAPVVKPVAQAPPKPPAAKPIPQPPAAKPAPKNTLPAFKAAPAKPAPEKRPVSKIVVSGTKSTGFDGSKEYNRKDFGKY